MKRILTAIVALPILLYSVWSRSPYFFVGLTTIAVILALSEFYNLASKSGARPLSSLGYVAALAVLAGFVFDEQSVIVAAIACLSIIALGVSAFNPDEMKNALVSVSSTTLGVIYVALLGGCLVGVRMLPDESARTVIPYLSSKLLTMFFAIVMMTDTGAYYTGRLMGRHKLAPRVSPGKTIEGAIGGYVMAVVTGVLCKLIFLEEIPLAEALGLGAAIGLIGQIGDLAESMLKRGAGVKDSGNLLPGHGGMLDRIDSILLCAPLLYCYSRLFATKL